MNVKIFSIVLFAVLAVLAGVEAGCGPNGCCYCHSHQGYVISHGLKAPNCFGGSECTCNHAPGVGYYGECAFDDILKATAE